MASCVACRMGIRRRRKNIPGAHFRNFEQSLQGESVEGRRHDSSGACEALELREGVSDICDREECDEFQASVESR